MSGHLIEPNALRPWSCEIVSAVPMSIMKLNDGGGDEPKKKKKKTASALDSSQINAGAVCPGWASLASWRGQIFVWPVNSNTASSTASPSKKHIIDAPKGCVTLFHPSLVGLSEDSSPPLIALARASADAVFVYAAQPASGGLVVWKVTQDDVRRAMTMPRPLGYAHTMLPLERKEVDDEDDDGNEYAGELEEFVTSLTAVDRHMVVLGTSKGGLICCTQSTIPVALHAQRMLKTSNSRKSLMGRFFGSSRDTNDGEPVDDSSIVFVMPIAASGDDGSIDLLAVSVLGSITHWRIIPTVATSHRVTTEGKTVTTVATLFYSNLSTNMNLTQVDILQAKLGGDRVHILVRTTQEGESGCRLFWVRLRLERDGTKVLLQWIDCQWLNRFPAPQDVNVMGLVLSQNGWAYAAFHQGSGGITSSVIIMATSDVADEEETDSSSMTVYEVDLPPTEIPALLPGTFTNDVVTHGCCVLARSGLGIRIRALPVTTADLSPRAAKRANPSAVTKLINHLRSAFWQAYQHQDASSSSLALPPSLLEASPVDLEEAVIAVATQLHLQRSNDAAAWTSASSALEANGLEWHLAFISFLRQGGLYRSLSNFAKWRLMALGAEVAVFLELVAPTRSSTSTAWEKEQISSLNLTEGTAAWLKQTLELVLRDGSMDQYQLWCGWFSTALTTAISHRRERGTATYDITVDNPPVVGSMNDEEDSLVPRVPVWTSHPLLQETFGTLLQHWRLHPKQKSVHILPPQTVEVIARAALDSFADSASSLSSERATGKYSEIKAMTIPLLRTLHPPTPQAPTSGRGTHKSDDNVAFQLAVRHDYYEAICQIALDHENKPDAGDFRLGTLLQSADQCQSVDFQTGYTFSQFVLQWHTDRGLYGHTILHGRLCQPRDLAHILQSDERLHPYRWIQAVHKGDFNGAASSLIGHAESSASVTLPDTKWSFCMAKLSNHVVLKESQSQRAEAQKRETKINNTLELVGVQKELLENSSGLSKSQSGQHLWSANRLLARALEQAEQADQENKDLKESAAHFLFLGLLVCLSSSEDKASQRRQAAQVWSKAIELDWQTQWTEWIRNEDDLSRDALAFTILDSTVFGGLLKECGDDRSLSTVTFCEFMENDIMEQLGLVGDSGVDSLKRLLNNVVRTFQETCAADEEMIEQGDNAMVVA